MTTTTMMMKMMKGKETDWSIEMHMWMVVCWLRWQWQWQRRLERDKATTTRVGVKRVSRIRHGISFSRSPFISCINSDRRNKSRLLKPTIRLRLHGMYLSLLMLLLLLLLLLSALLLHFCSALPCSARCIHIEWKRRRILHAQWKTPRERERGKFTLIRS